MCHMTVPLWLIKGIITGYSYSSFGVILIHHKTSWTPVHVIIQCMGSRFKMNKNSDHGIHTFDWFLLKTKDITGKIVNWRSILYHETFHELFSWEINTKPCALKGTPIVLRVSDRPPGIVFICPSALSWVRGWRTMYALHGPLRQTCDLGL